MDSSIKQHFVVLLNKLTLTFFLTGCIIASLPSFTTTSYSLDLSRRPWSSSARLCTKCLQTKSPLALPEPSIVLCDPLMPVNQMSKILLIWPILNYLNNRMREDLSNSLPTHKRSFLQDCIYFPLLLKMNKDPTQPFKSNYCSSVHFGFLTCQQLRVVQSEFLAWMIHFPADISQAATIKNYKLNFGSDLHIYLFVQVLLSKSC